MIPARLLAGAVTVAVATNPSNASLSYQITQPALLPGYSSLELWWDGGGTDDWLSAALRVVLTAGSIYNELFLDISPQDVVNPQFWAFQPTLEFETWVGPANQVGIAGGAGDLGGGPLNLDGPISVTWFNVPSNDTGLVKIANITFSNDAQGTFAARSANFQISGVIPEPASAALVGISGLALLRRT